MERTVEEECVISISSNSGIEKGNGKLTQLPMHLWGAKSLDKIGSAIGKPSFINEYTATKLQESYVRILVEVYITQKHMDSIAIKDNEGRRIVNLWNLNGSLVFVTYVRR